MVTPYETLISASPKVSGGWLLVVQIAALIAITLGCIQLSRSLSMVHGPQQPAPGPAASGG